MSYLEGYVGTGVKKLGFSLFLEPTQEKLQLEPSPHTDLPERWQDGTCTVQPPSPGTSQKQ
jgi:hypothetical protein